MEKMPGEVEKMGCTGGFGTSVSLVTVALSLLAVSFAPALSIPTASARPGDGSTISLPGLPGGEQDGDGAGSSHPPPRPDPPSDTDQPPDPRPPAPSRPAHGPDPLLVRCASAADLDGDRIDDRLEELAASGAQWCHAFVDFSRPVGPGDADALGSLGVTVRAVARSIDAACVDDFPLDALANVAALEGVFLVEYAPSLSAALDISAPAVRAAASNVYSPCTAADSGLSGDGISIAVLDTGVDDTVHNSFRMSFAGGADFTGAVTHNNTNPDDDNGHGTHCAGIALGKGAYNGTGRGVAPNASLIDLKVADEAGDSWSTTMVEALQWCIDNRVAYNLRVASISYGSQESCDGTDSLSRQVNAAVNAGISVVASMGNQGASCVPSPAAADGAIAVGALDDKDTIGRKDDRLGSYSNRGPRPSDGDRYSTDELKPDLCAPGTDVVAPRYDSVAGYVADSGTSMAVPHVSGTIALVLEAAPCLTPAQVRGVLRSGAQSAGSPSQPSTDPDWNNGFGWGMLDAYAAVRLAGNLGTPDLEGPFELNGSETGIFTADAEFTRTELDAKAQTLEMSFEGPDDWTEPAGIEVDGGEAEHQVTIEGPESGDDGTWRFGVVITYDGAVDSPVECDVSVRFLSMAPGKKPSNAMFGMETLFDGVPGDGVTWVVNREGTWKEADLYITNDDISFSDERPAAGEDVGITAVVHNGGMENLRGVRVRFTDGPPQTGLEIAVDTVDLGPGRAVTACASWVATPGVHTIYVQADCDDRFVETDENNNTGFRTLSVASPGPGVGPGGRVNLPPEASLRVTPDDAAVGEEVLFDASESSDRGDGQVVWYEFDFGDGSSSGRVTDSSVTHVYTGDGRFTPSVVVEDNGGRTSAPAYDVVNATFTQSGSIGLYLSEDHALVPASPGDQPPLSAPLPSGATARSIRPLRAGLWSGDEELLDSPIITNGPARVTVFVRNGADADVNYAGITFSLLVDNATVAEGRSVNGRLAPDETAVFESEMDLPQTRIDRGDIISLDVCAQVVSEELELLYWGWAEDSRVYLEYVLPVEVPPVANAGADLSAFAGEPVTFNGTGTDADGQVERFSWDFDTDGTTDHVSTSPGPVEHTYDVPGHYTATLTVEDDDGLTDSDALNVTVSQPPVNEPPVVDIRAPDGEETLTGTVKVKGTASDDVEVAGVQVAVDGAGWRDARGTESWTFSWDTSEVPDGAHTLDARSYDGKAYSRVYSVKVTVRNDNSEPRVEDLSWDPAVLRADGQTPVTLSARVTDGDGADDIISVEADLGALGGGTEHEMYPEPDRGDGWYAVTFTIDGDVDTGGAVVSVTARDLMGGVGTLEVAVEVLPPNSPPEIEDVSVRPDVVEAGEKTTVTIEVSVRDDDGMDDVKLVELDGSGVGLDAHMALRDDGMKGDATPGDGVYTLQFVAGRDLEEGEYDLKLRVEDRGGAGVVEKVMLLVRGDDGGEAGASRPVGLGGEGGDPLGAAGFSLLGLMVLAVAGAVMVVRRRGR